LAGLETEALDLVDNDSAKFDLALELPSSPQSRGYFEYNTDLFEEARIVRMAEYFHTLLAELLDHPETKLMKLNAMHKMTRN
jgi:non-ribosomal peptide synthetase component F